MFGPKVSTTSLVIPAQSATRSPPARRLSRHAAPTQEPPRAIAPYLKGEGRGGSGESSEASEEGQVEVAVGSSAFASTRHRTSATVLLTAVPGPGRPRKDGRLVKCLLRRRLSHKVPDAQLDGLEDEKQREVLEAASMCGQLISYRSGGTTELGRHLSGPDHVFELSSAKVRAGIALRPQERGDEAVPTQTGFAAVAKFIVASALPFRGRREGLVSRSAFAAHSLHPKPSSGPRHGHAAAQGSRTR